MFVASPNKRNSFRRIPSCAEHMSGLARENETRSSTLSEGSSKRRDDEAVIVFKAVDHGKLRIGCSLPLGRLSRELVEFLT